MLPWSGARPASSLLPPSPSFCLGHRFPRCSLRLLVGLHLPGLGLLLLGRFPGPGCRSQALCLVTIPTLPWILTRNTAGSLLYGCWDFTQNSLLVRAIGLLTTLPPRLLLALLKTAFLKPQPAPSGPPGQPSKGAFMSLSPLAR